MIWLLDTSTPSTPLDIRSKQEEKSGHDINKKSEDAKKKLEHSALPKALNDFTRHKEEKERNELLEKNGENKDGNWGKAQENEVEEDDAYDETSEQASKEEKPKRNLEELQQNFTVINEGTIPSEKNISKVDETNSKSYIQVRRYLVDVK